MIHTTTTIVAVVTLLMLLVATSLRVNALIQPRISDLELLHEWVSLDYDWSDSPWPNRTAAKSNGAFIEENNVITGVNVYKDMLFVCVPRWRPGVPATLNRVVVDPATKQPILVPFPSWDMNLNKFHYVQSIWVDQARGLMYVIDTGRENFFAQDPALIQNRTAALYVLDLNDSNNSIVHEHHFAPSIFDPKTSFLNDIVVDESKNVAYMSDTNIAGLGGLVMYDLTTGAARRFQDPSSTFANKSYVITINGVAYPFNSPVDGIALSSDGRRLYYSPVEGAALYSLDATVFAAAGATTADIQATVRRAGEKQSASDGLRFMPAPPGTGLVDFVVYGSNCENSLMYARIVPRMPQGHQLVDSVLLEKDDFSMQWFDTFAKRSINETHTQLLFTTNRLQLYLTRTMDWTGAQGANMRVYSAVWRTDAPAPSNN